MVWPFKKQRGVVDLTYLAKRGLIKPEQEQFKDISQSSQSSNSADSGLGFLGAMASSAESPTTPSVKEVTPNKIDDIEYKMEVISKRVNAVLDRLDLVEKKVDRAGRQGSI